MFQKSKLVRQIFYGNIIFFIFCFLFPELFNIFAIYPFDRSEFEFYQFLTSLFTHAGPLHLLFNMLGLLSFGPQCELDLGEKKFLAFYLIAGFFGALVQISITPNPLVGASAAIFGLIIYATLLNPNQKLMIIFLPFLSFKAKWLVGVFVLFEIYAAFYISDNVGHFAHLSGGLIGLITFFLQKKINIVK